MDFYDHITYNKRTGLWCDKTGYPITERGIGQQPIVKEEIPLLLVDRIESRHHTTIEIGDDIEAPTVAADDVVTPNFTTGQINTEILNVDEVYADNVAQVVDFHDPLYTPQVYTAAVENAVGPLTLESKTGDITLIPKTPTGIVDCNTPTYRADSLTTEYPLAAVDTFYKVSYPNTYYNTFSASMLRVDTSNTFVNTSGRRLYLFVTSHSRVSWTNTNGPFRLGYGTAKGATPSGAWYGALRTRGTITGSIVNDLEDSIFCTTMIDLDPGEQFSMWVRVGERVGTLGTTDPALAHKRNHILIRLML